MRWISPTIAIFNNDWSETDYPRRKRGARKPKARTQEVRAFFVYDGLGEYRGRHDEATARSLTLNNDWTMVEAR